MAPARPTLLELYPEPLLKQDQEQKQERQKQQEPTPGFFPVDLQAARKAPAGDGDLRVGAPGLRARSPGQDARRARPHVPVLVEGRARPRGGGLPELGPHFFHELLPVEEDIQGILLELRVRDELAQGVAGVLEREPRREDLVVVEVGETLDPGQDRRDPVRGSDLTQGDEEDESCRRMTEPVRTCESLHDMWHRGIAPVNQSLQMRVLEKDPSDRAVATSDECRMERLFLVYVVDESNDLRIPGIDGRVTIITARS